MAREKDVPTGQATHDEHTPEAPERTYGSDLKMPQEDDPAGEGHMWSGKTDVPQTPASEDEGEIYPLGEHH